MIRTRQIGKTPTYPREFPGYSQGLKGRIELVLLKKTASPWVPAGEATGWSPVRERGMWKKPCVFMSSPHIAKPPASENRISYIYIHIRIYIYNGCGMLWLIVPHYSTLFLALHGWADAKSMASCNSRSNILRMCFMKWTLHDGTESQALSWRLPQGGHRTCLKQGANLETKGGCLVGKSGREAWPHVVTTQQCTHCLSSTWSWRLTLYPGVVSLDKTYCICGLSPWVVGEFPSQETTRPPLTIQRRAPTCPNHVQRCAKQSRESRDTKSFQDIVWAFGILQITVVTCSDQAWCLHLLALKSFWL